MLNLSNAMIVTTTVTGWHLLLEEQQLEFLQTKHTGRSSWLSNISMPNISRTKHNNTRLTSLEQRAFQTLLLRKFQNGIRIISSPTRSMILAT
jgi:hypothetical protein